MVKIVAPNFDLKYGLSKDQIKKRFEKLIKYSEPDKDKRTLFIWPEGVFSGYSYQEVLSFSNLISEKFSNKHQIIFGINKADRKSGNFFNSMLVVDHNFKVLQRYDKRKLVPFGEYLPFEKLMNSFGLKKSLKVMVLLLREKRKIIF